MPPFGSELTADEIAAVIPVVKAFRRPPPANGP
jgi:hypothetical protein